MYWRMLITYFLILCCNTRNNIKIFINTPSDSEYYILDIIENKNKCNFCSSNNTINVNRDRILLCKNVNKCYISFDFFGQKNETIYPIYDYHFYPDSINKIDSLYAIDIDIGEITFDWKTRNYFYFYLDHINNILSGKNKIKLETMNRTKMINAIDSIILANSSN